MKNKCKKFLSVQMRKDNLRQRGITLIALIITIIVLLILAGVAFSVLGTNNGILKRAVEVAKISKATSADEKVNFLLSEYAIDKYTKEQANNGIHPLVNFFNEQLEKGEIDAIVSETGDDKSGTVTIEIDDYQYTIDKETLEVIGEPVLVNGETPKLAVVLSDLEAEGVLGGNQVLTVNITNASSFDSYTIDVRHTDGTEPVGIALVGEGQESYKITKDGTCVVSVTATKGEITNSAKQSKTITLQFSKVSGVNGILLGQETTIKNNAVIDIVWLDANNEVIKKPEAPVLLEGMQPIKWVEKVEKPADENNIGNDWYEYVAQTGTTDGTSRWANAKTSDGNAYFVWIPRYAYKITYYSDAAKTNVVGYSQIDGMVNANGKVVNGTNPINVNGRVKTGGYTEYIPHPGFEFGTSKTGMWVGKFESNGTLAEGTQDGITVPLPTSNITIKPGQKSLFGSGRKNIRLLFSSNKTYGR